MVSAYILIMCKSGAEQGILNQLRSKSEINNVAIVYGEWDVVAKINTNSIEEINSFVIQAIRPIKDIEKTATLITVS
jgi:anthranilate phosphoribosyltransferase